jgi:hypothetical protein
MTQDIKKSLKLKLPSIIYGEIVGEIVEVSIARLW